MRLVFADTLYWGALLNPKDQYSEVAREVRNSLGEIRLVTTEEVLTELLDALCERGVELRRIASSAVIEIVNSDQVTVEPQSHDSFMAGVHLYRTRLDKAFSLVDCVSMNTMRRMNIKEALTNDHHFTQAGFIPLLRRE
jgi:predicted nucleic acid-binding protein